MKITRCRSCGSSNLHPVLSLGETPLANALIWKEHLDIPEPKFPLEVVFCSDCTLVQITETVPPEILFRDYVYYSSFSDTVVKNGQQITDRILNSRSLGPDSLVVEIASNDGYLLNFYKQAGIPILGIEPAINIAKYAEEHGVATLAEFFNESLANWLKREGRQADVFHANNVLAHVADLNGVVAGMGIILKDQGIGVIEFPYVKDMIDGVEFDTIYHEHLCYYSLTSVSWLFERHGMKIVDVERIPIHGGSLRIFVAHNIEENLVSDRVAVLRQEELGWGVNDLSFYEQFGAKVEGLRNALTACLYDLKINGKKIAAYGASAKGATLLNTFGIGADTIKFVVDRSTIKQGLYTPGTHLPILDPEQLMVEKPDYVLLLTWNFAEEILNQQVEYRNSGGKFIVPIPRLEIV